MKIFVVDDNLTCLAVYSKLIRKLGYHDVSVYKNSTALLSALPNQPKVIFLDYQLDHMNGLDLLKKIKRQDPDIFVVFVSGQTTIPIVVNSLKYGAFDYLTKEEFNAERLVVLFEKLEQINNAIELRQKKKKIGASLAAAASLAAIFLAKPFTQNSNL